jgi:hypothetical protein
MARSPFVIELGAVAADGSGGLGCELVQGLVRVKKKEAVSGNGGAPQQSEDGETIKPGRLRAGRFIQLPEGECRRHPQQTQRNGIVQVRSIDVLVGGHTNHDH